MTFTPGRYKTYDGHDAIVAQVKTASRNQWVLRGAIICAPENMKNVLAIQVWTINGVNTNGIPDHDLVPRC